MRKVPRKVFFYVCSRSLFLNAEEKFPRKVFAEGSAEAILEGTAVLRKVPAEGFRGRLTEGYRKVNGRFSAEG